MLEISRLTVKYRSILAVSDLSIVLDKGEIVAVIGANGAGKSTLMNAVMNLVKKQSGEVAYKSKDITNLAPYKIPLLGIGYGPEGRHLFGKLSAKENLELGAISSRKGKSSLPEEIKAVYRLFPILESRQNQLAGTLSGGEQQMLAMARVLMMRPEVCLFDEPSFGLAPIIQNEIFCVTENLRKQGVTTLLVEQNAKKALEISDRCYVMELGRVVLEGTSETISTNPQIEKAYLGG